MKTIRKDSLQDYIGVACEPTSWFEVKQPQINQFADCTYDHQFIHVDEEQAKQTVFGSTIAHGFLSLSLLPYFYAAFGYLIEGMYMGVNYGLDKVRFIAPVKVNSRIRARATLLDAVEKKPGQFALTYEITIEIEGEDKPALVAVWIAMQMVS